MKVTIQKFYRITGGSTQYKGVEPDIPLPSLLETLKSGERYLEYSLPWDSIQPVVFTSFAGPPLHLAALRARSAQRVEKDEGFQVIRTEIARVQEWADNTVISLNIDDMRKKQEEARLAKEKVGKQFRLFQEEEQVGEEPDEESDEQESGTKAWLDEVRDDPYIREAGLIVADMLQGI